MNQKRQVALVVLGCLAGAGLALFAATRTWVVEVVARPAPLPPHRTPHSGAQLLAWLPALAVAALAGSGALLATRRAGRTVIGVLLAVSGLGVAIGGGYGLVAVDGVSPAWPALCVLGGLVVAAAGALAVSRGRSWTGLGSRYDRPQRTHHRPSPRQEPVSGLGPPLPPESGSPRMSGKDLWDALDRGEDPTADR